jgi:hypothetical protein
VHTRSGRRLSRVNEIQIPLRRKPSADPCHSSCSSIRFCIVECGRGRSAMAIRIICILPTLLFRFLTAGSSIFVAHVRVYHCPASRHRFFSFWARVSRCPMVFYASHPRLLQPRAREYLSLGHLCVD